MAGIVVIGGGMGGLSTALLLAGDGHEVTVLERDPAPPPAAAETAWEDWDRKGVNQFRMIHFFLPRFRGIVEAELPDVAKALDADGALRLNAVMEAPDFVSGGHRDGDERFDALTGRRPVVESAFARVADATPGITVRRGATVQALLTGDAAVAGVPHVVGVVIDGGEEIRADLVVDASGRRSALPRLLADIGARAPVEELEDSGFMYYGRYFRSPDGSLPFAMGPPLQHYESISILALPADNGTWGMGLITSAADAAMRPAKGGATWEAIVSAYPLIAHWLEGEPITDVEIMAKIEDRLRSFVVDGSPVATGVAPVADAWACTNPSVGRGASIGLIHAQALRDLIRDQGLGDPTAFALAWHDTTVEKVEPYYRDTLSLDRHRLAEIEAQIAGVPYETDDPAYAIGQAMQATASQDPDIFRGAVDIASLLARPEEVLERPGLLERVIELSQASTPEPLPGPTRAELLDLIQAV
jgi:2-polyprenyl-6-methoxyphenol hydroxylase-like FAD-dependent oxidoreductase